MTWEAVDTILDKAWEMCSQASIYLENTGAFFSINSKNHEWKVYETLNILCIHVLEQKIEYYIDINKITHICVM